MIEPFDIEGEGYAHCNLYAHVRRSGARGRVTRGGPPDRLPCHHRRPAAPVPVFSAAPERPSSYGGSSRKTDALSRRVCYNIDCSSLRVVETATHCYTKLNID